jgi:ketosteroid isomerase-like protein
MTIDEFLNRFEAVKKAGPDEWMVRCPAHADRTPSLSISLTNDRILVHCQTGCATPDVVAAVGLKMADLFLADGTERTTKSTTKSTASGATQGHSPRRSERVDNPFKHLLKSKFRDSTITAAYPYVDEDCKLLFAVCRTADKQFPAWRPDPWAKNGRDWHVKDGDEFLVRPVLYHLPRLLGGVKAHETVHVVDGEKDVESLEAIGRYATTWPHVFGGWRAEYSAFLSGADVRVWVDQDDGAGERQADEIVAALEAAS